MIKKILILKLNNVIRIVFVILNEDEDKNYFTVKLKMKATRIVIFSPRKRHGNIETYIEYFTLSIIKIH